MNSAIQQVSTPAPAAASRRLVLGPPTGWLDLHLADLWRYRDLVAMFVLRDFTAQFKQTILGPAWFLIQPLLTTLMFTVVFGSIAGLSTDGLPKVLFYLSGNVLWLYFSECLTRTANTFTGNVHLFEKVYFPRLAVPVSVVISGLFRLLLQIGFFLCFWAYYRLRGAPIRLTPSCLLLPLAVVIMAALALGLGVLFSSLTAKYRDLRFLLDFGVRLLMYAAPVIYPLSAIGPKWRWLVLANPMTALIETFRHGFLGVGTVNAWHLAYSAGFALAALLLGAVVFTRVERTFVDTV